MRAILFCLRIDGGSKPPPYGKRLQKIVNSF